MAGTEDVKGDYTRRSGAAARARATAFTRRPATDARPASTRAAQ